jgi:hypothetical protein
MPAQQNDFGFVGQEYVAENPFVDRQVLVNWYCAVTNDRGAKGAPASSNPNSNGVIGLLGCPGLIVVASVTS